MLGTAVTPSVFSSTYHYRFHSTVLKDSWEESLGAFNVICFVLGIPLTVSAIMHCFSSKRSLVCITLGILNIIFFIRVFLDVHVGIRVFSEHRLFSSYHLTNLWGYVDCVTSIWSWEMVSLLAVASLVNPSKRTALIIGIILILYAMSVEAIPVMHGLTYTFLPTIHKPIRSGLHNFPGGYDGIRIYHLLTLGVPYLAAIFILIISLIIHLIQSLDSGGFAKQLRETYMNVFKRSVPYRGFTDERGEEEDDNDRIRCSNSKDQDIKIVVGVIAIYLLFEVPRIVVNSIVIGNTIIPNMRISNALYYSFEKLVDIW